MIFATGVYGSTPAGNPKEIILHENIAHKVDNLIKWRGANDNMNGREQQLAGDYMGLVIM